MDDLEARQIVTTLEDILNSVYAAQRDLPAERATSEFLRQTQIKLEKAVQAYREKYNAHRT